MKKSFFKVLAFILFLPALLMAGSLKARAEETAEAKKLDITVTISDGTSAAKLLDANYESAIKLNAGTKITIEAAEPMKGLYVIWDSLVPEWTLTLDGKETVCGKNGFLHEYISIPDGAKQAVIEIPDGGKVGTQSGTVQGGMRISDVYAYSEGKLPESVQVWKPVTDRADILFFSTHGDDEHIFFGGVLEYYGKELGLDVQVAYFTQHWVYDASSKIREHEKLNGLWLAGADRYPILGSFPDAYSTTLDGALKTISLDDGILFITQCIRRCKPQVVLTHDINGEYGHGQHMLVSKATIAAVEKAEDASFDEATAAKYGTWSVPKFYIHLYKENPVHIDYRKPLESFGGKTALDVAKEAYKCHISQQWCWFYVSDDYEYSISDYGLYRTNVGPDVNGDDFMENIVSYAEQDRIAEEERLAEEARKKAEEERLAEEARKKAEEEQRQKEEEQRKKEEAERKLHEEELEAQRKADEEYRRQQAELELELKKAQQRATIVLGVCAAICVVAAAGAVFLIKRRR
ncbi:MAG: PIG-L family deacetylase [Lachnospiraceae bacterium]|nr:PIG-L family deacetylase [Lachnospiraceae bacterium]